MYYGTTNCEILVTQLAKSSICKVFWQSAMDAHDTICMLPMPLHLTGWRHVFYFKPHTLDLFWLHFVTIVPSMFFASCGQLIHFLPLWWAFQNYKIPSLWLLTTFIMFVKVIPSLQLIIGCGHCKEQAWRCDVWCDWCDRCQVALYEMHQMLWSPAVQVLKSLSNSHSRYHKQLGKRLAHDLITNIYLSVSISFLLPLGHSICTCTLSMFIWSITCIKW
jgi:hypothetical protein